MRVYLNDGGNGDCLILATENTSIMIDGGTASSYKSWNKILSKFSKFDALFVTHIDNDHVNGLIRMLEEKSHPILKEVFFNGIEQLTSAKRLEENISQEEASALDTIISNFSKDVEGESDIGFSEGTSLSFILETLNYRINERFESGVITNTSVPDKFIIGDITIEIIGPTDECISKIKSDWINILSEYGLKMKGLHKKHSIAFEKYIDSLNSDIDGEEICGSSCETIEQLSDVPFVDDGSLNNMSSISFLAEFNEKKVLFLGDSDTKTITQWMDLKGYETLEVDAVKLPHHGSKHNYNRILLERILCKRYLISTNGKKHSHPDLETLARIVRYSKKQPVDIYINHPIAHVNESFKEKFSKYSCGSKILINEKEILI